MQKPKKDEWIKVAALMGHKVYLQKVVYIEEGEARKKALNNAEQVEAIIPYLQSTQGELEGLTSSTDDEFKPEKFGYFDWIKGSKVIYIEPDEYHPYPRCLNLFLISEKKVEKVRPPCWKDNFFEKQKRK